MPDARGAKRDQTNVSPPPPRVRAATHADLPAIEALERLCFPPSRQASPRSLVRSLLSQHQEVWVTGRPVQAFCIVWRSRRALRIYDIATHPEARGKGFGAALLRHVERQARLAGLREVRLEASPDAPGLIPWYEQRGYTVVAHRRDYYAPRQHAVRMVKQV